jgi:hypothetical protein
LFLQIKLKDMKRIFPVALLAISFLLTTSCGKDGSNDVVPSNITYKDLNISLNTSSISGSGTNIDIDADGFPDFVVKFSHTYVEYDPLHYTNYYNLSLYSAGGDYDLLTHDDNLYGDFPTKTVPYVNLLDLNAIINDAQSYWMDGSVLTTEGYIIYYYNTYSSTLGTSDGYKNEDISTASKYIGIRYWSDGVAYYGWIKARVTVSDKIDNITFESAALYKLESTEIKAGQK